MATITAATTAPAIAGAAFHRKISVGASTPLIQGLPRIRVRVGRVWCSAKNVPTSNSTGVSLVAVAASMVAASGSAVALVDERMSTEGTGLSLGLSNNLLGWILLAVFGLIWSLYFVYTSTLEEDEESGLSL